MTNWLNGIAFHEKTYLKATESHLPQEITHDCYLPSDTGERAPPLPTPDRSVLDLTPEGQKAELITVLVI